MNSTINYPSERLTAGPATVVICTLGLIINCSAAFRLSQIYRNSQCFALYCLAHLLSDSLVLLVFLFYVAPKLMFPEIWPIPPGYVSKVGYLALAFQYCSFYTTMLITTIIPPGHVSKVGYLALAFQYCSFYTTMLITLNRAYVVIFPFKNTAFIRVPFAIGAIFGVWMFALGSSLIVVIPGCSFTFRLTTMIWRYADTECGRTISLYFDLVYNCLFFAVLIAIDIFTVIYSQYRNKYIWKLDHGASATETARRRRQEIGFFIQSCVVSAGFVWMLCCYHIFIYLFDSILWNFSQTTMAWQLSHCTHGLVIIFFNWKRRKRNTSPLDTAVNSVPCTVSSTVPRIVNGTVPGHRPGTVPGTKNGDHDLSRVSC